jgi:uncharacterized Zn-finger protein
MPTDQAWRQIRQEGLITYWMQNGSQQPQSAPTTASPSQAVASTTPQSTAPAPIAPVTNVPPPSDLASQSLPMAQAVPGLDGYVRSPFTNPPRLVDVRGMASGSKVVCPYTSRPFLVPSAPKTEAPAVASTPAPAPVTPAPEPAPTPAPTKPAAAPLPSTPTKVAVNTASAPTPPPTPTKPQIKPSPAPIQTPPPAPAKPAVANEMPFGTPIPGRPGFVNSPFAAKHQLVDVTGLPTGMEVKCPYTGKLFRVPPGANEPAKQ